MTTNDELLSGSDHETRPVRFSKRNKRKTHRWRWVLLIASAAMAVAVLVGPSWLCGSSWGRAMVAEQLAHYGLDCSIGNIQLGWSTTLKANQVELSGASGQTHLTIQQVDVDMTLLDLLAGSDSIGEVTLRNVNLEYEVSDGRSSIEDDLRQLTELTRADRDPSSANRDADPAPTMGPLKLLDVTAKVTDRVTAQAWRITQTNVEIALGDRSTQAAFAGVFTEPGGSAGSLQGDWQLDSSDPSKPTWNVSLSSESLPLSIVALLRRRFPESIGSIPRVLAGDATGKLTLVGDQDGNVEADVEQLAVRNLTAIQDQTQTEQSELVWRNQFATVDGKLSLLPSRVVGKQFAVSTDFGKATIDGVLLRDISWTAAADQPLGWLDGMDGRAGATIDLASLQRALPGLLPIREDASFDSGQISATVQSFPAQHPGGPRRSRLAIASTRVAATSIGRPVRIDPIELTAQISSHQGHVRAEEFRWTSQFGSAVGQGDLKSGEAEFQIDFGRLASILDPIVDFSGATIDGAAEGKLQWQAADNRQWRLFGTGSATDLVVTSSDGQTYQRGQLAAKVEALGTWGRQKLERLSQAVVELGGNHLNFTARLREPIDEPTAEKAIPLDITGSGKVASAFSLIQNFVSPEVRDATGTFELAARATASATTIELTDAALTLTNPEVVYRTTAYHQPTMDVRFDGHLDLPSGHLSADQLTVNADAFSAEITGRYDDSSTDLDLHWRVILQELQDSMKIRLVGRRSPSKRNSDAGQVVGFERREFQPRSDQPSTDNPVDWEQWDLRGLCEGDCKISGQGQSWLLRHRFTASDCQVIQRPSSAGSLVPGIPSSNRSDAFAWTEPKIESSGAMRIDLASGKMVVEPTELATDWFATTIEGSAAWSDQIEKIQIDGPAQMKMDVVATKLEPIVGMQVRTEGIHQMPLSIRVARGSRGDLNVEATTDVGWEAGELEGVRFGKANVPVQFQNGTWRLGESRVPVGDGYVRVAGRIHHHDGNAWLEVPGGTVAESIELTPEMTNRWLKYIAPLAAQATQIQGTFSADIEPSQINLADPASSRLAGRLNLGGAEMNLGPLAQQLVGSVNQVTSLTSAVTGTQPKPFADRNQTLVSMPPQQVDFQVSNGVVGHERMFFKVDRAEIVTSGNVRVSDGRLAMNALIPLDPRWLGKDLQSLAGQTVTLPIDGTLDQPSLDSAGLTQLVSGQAAQAIQTTAENYLRKQLNRNLDKLFGR